ncbi:MAG: biopolymer transporter ExbD [Prevotella sp.]|nr:biopolymer transporter ExbD [Prevotella sp.]
MFRRKNRDIPELSTTSTADISFMLLIFFLMTSSLDSDKGLARQLPPPDTTEEQADMMMNKRNVMQLCIDSNNLLTCNGDTITCEELTRRVQEFVANANDDPELPEKSRREVHLIGLTSVSDRHVITIEVSRQTTYEAYFNMQNAIVKGYALLRNDMARQRFGHSLAQCSQQERDALAMVFPQRISEVREEISNK